MVSVSRLLPAVCASPGGDQLADPKIERRRITDDLESGYRFREA
jgi:hypothetical protein